MRENFSNRAQHASADGEEAADGARCDGGPRGRPRSESVHCKRSLGGMSRADVSWLRLPPGQHPHPLLHQISPWASRSGEGESRAEVRCVRENFSNRAQHASADGEEAADGARCDGGPRGGPGRNRYTVNAR